MNLIEQIVREEIRNVIASIVRTELAKVTGSVVTGSVTAPVAEVKSRRSRSRLTARLSEMEPGQSISIPARSVRRSRNSLSYATRKFGMRFSMRKHGAGYRIFCLKGVGEGNLEQVIG